VDVVDILSRELKTRHVTIEEEETDDSFTKNTSTTTVSGISDIYVDAHVPNLLVLPPTASSWLHHDYDLVQSGKIVLQDKSSCFSALVLMNGIGEGLVAKNDDDTSIPPPCSFDYIDACSAPGNKTSHLAALVHNRSIINNGGDDDDTLQRKQKKKKKKGKTSLTPKSTIFAFERSSTRFTTLKQRMKQLIPSSSDVNSNNNNNSNTNVVVDPIHGDFLKADPLDPKFNNVRAIMLDPSCSGSGIVNSPDRWMDDTTTTNDDDDNNNNNKDVKRIQSLSNFQLVALKHAMSFPNVTKIVYSTCSIHTNENEIVVATALREVEKSNDGNDWEIMAPTCLDHWSRRGREVDGLTKYQAGCLIRCDGLDGDETNGFFVAFLVRKKLILDAAAGHTTTTLRAKGIEDYLSVSIPPTYNGQFVDLCKRRSRMNVLPAFAAASDNPKQLLSSSSNHDSSESTKLMVSPGGKKQQHDNKKLSCTTKLNTKSAKKREKKLAWKRNQALLKSSRLKKKEGGVVVAPNLRNIKGCIG
jgi:putative methyltransferase